MLADELLQMVVSNPSAAGVNNRQAAKLYRRLEKVNEDRSEATLLAIDVGRERVKNASATIYMVNVGSSGSHWAQAMLSALAPMLPCGEVYFPDPLLGRIAEMQPEERGTFMHAYYAIHGWSNGPELKTGAAINTAHKANPMAMAQHEHSACLILLIRDPVEIVMSRTFRKHEYRVATGHADTPDADYMQVNIKFVRNFFRSVERVSFQAEVRYEDLRDQPAMALRSLAGAIGLDVSEETVHRVADEYRAERLAARGRAGNLYRGPTVSPPDELVEMAKEDLADIRERFGY